MMTDFVVIELSKIITPDTNNTQIRAMWSNLNIPIPTDIKSNPFMKEEGKYELYIWFMAYSEKVSKIWVNPKNGYIIAYEDREGYKFSEHFIEHLNYIEPLEINTNHMKYELNIDSILDKISNSGINSLTKEEREYLDSIN